MFAYPPPTENFLLAQCSVLLTEERPLIFKPTLAVFLSAVTIAHCKADCQIADAGLGDAAVLRNPRLRGPTNSQSFRDLRSLRDAALRFGHGRYDDCERLLANIRELIAGPPMGSL
jgi:hypothetical protein